MNFFYEKMSSMITIIFTFPVFLCVFTNECSAIGTDSLEQVRINATSGSTEAQFLLGKWFVTDSVDISNENEEALYWLKEAANKGLADAQNELVSRPIYYLHNNC